MPTVVHLPVLLRILLRLTRKPAIAALLGAVASFTATTVLTYKTKQWDTEQQIKLRDLSDRRQVYIQLKGQRAVLLQIGSEMINAADKLYFYEIRAAQVDLKGTAKHSSRYSQGFLDDAMQQERVSERYRDQLTSCVQKVNESLAMVHLLFPPDPRLDELLRAVEDMPNFDYQKPEVMELMKDSANDYLNQKAKQTEAQMKNRYGKRIDDLLSYLDQKLVAL